MQLLNFEFPSGALPLDSQFYIERSPLENFIYEQISQDGSFLWIKSPVQMGKTSLVFRLMARSRKLGYHTVYLDLQKADENIFISLDKFLRWFCISVTQQLKKPLKLDEFWDDAVGSKVSSTVYFADYLLKEVKSPLVIVLHDINIIFNYPNLASHFLRFLRSWYEDARHNHILAKLRFVLVYDTELDIIFNIHKSSKNVGIQVDLPKFSLEEIHELAARYGLNWSNKAGKRHAFTLKTILGGHPYLVQLTLYNLVKNHQTNLQSLLKQAPTINGIYSPHLQRLVAMLQKRPELAITLKNIIRAGGSLELESTEQDCIWAYKLESMGLVKVNSNKYSISCELYRQFFAAQNFDNFSIQSQIEQLRTQNLYFKHLCYVDDLTQLYNKRYFYTYLENSWNTSVAARTPLSLIVLDIDNLKIYNLTCGQKAGDECVQKIARVISNCVDNTNAAVTRYQDDTFAVILNNTTANNAFEIAETIRLEVKQLAIKHAISKVGGLKLPVVTVSLGVACTIPLQEQSETILIDAAFAALFQAKKCEGNCTCVAK